ncbi:4'-phosphopantetheinyl transferase family protein [Streptomyces sp. NPDC056480]|uniref:4'-phosphopantetheinyl transferase family protein n=1 Tax=Streptomyces sp. NPDC056480 TaxID=3345833 RepID=UPI003684C8D7
MASREEPARERDGRDRHEGDGEPASERTRDAVPRARPGDGVPDRVTDRASERAKDGVPEHAPDSAPDTAPENAGERAPKPAPDGVPGPAEVGADVARALRAGRETHVWWWTSPECTDPDDLPLLDTEEFRRALSMPAERDAAAFVRSRAVVRRALAGLFGLDPRDLVLGTRGRPGREGTGHGPPQLVVPALPLVLSISRTDGHGLFALGAGTSIGVDAEALRPVAGRPITDADLTDAERRHLRGLPAGPERDGAFHRIWTRKEAVAKASGLGLSGIELGLLETRPAHPGPVRVAQHDLGRTTAWHVEDLHVVEGVAAALARPARPEGHGPVHHHTYGADTRRSG